MARRRPDDPSPGTDIAQQWPHVRQQVMAEQYRLRVLQVGAAGHRDPVVAICLREKGIDDIEDTAR